MIIPAKLELILLITATAHVHVVLRLTRILWLTLIVLFSLTALHEPSARWNCSLMVLFYYTWRRIHLLCVVLCSSFLLDSVSFGHSLKTRTIPNNSCCESLFLQICFGIKISTQGKSVSLLKHWTNLENCLNVISKRRKAPGVLL